MFEPTATDPPLTSPTDDQREALRNYFGNCTDCAHLSHPIDFALMLCGEKPACTMHPTEDEFPSDPFTPAAGLRRLCHMFGLSYRQCNGWWFVAHTGARLDLLPTSGRGRLSPQAARRFGAILGYPQSAVEAFIDAEGQLPDPQDSLHGQHPPEEIADVAFLSYKMDNPETALKRGRRIRRRLEHLADVWAVPELNDFIAEHRRETLNELRVNA